MPMQPDELAKYREILLDKRESLLGQVASLDEVALNSAQATENSKSPLSIAENASDSYEQDFAFINMESEEDLLHLIEGYGLVRAIVTEGSPLVSASLAESKLTEKGTLVLGIEREKAWIPIPKADEPIKAGDRLVVYGSLEGLKTLLG